MTDPAPTENAVPIALPDLGAEDAMVVTNWYAQPGESVDAGERVVEVLLPGVTFDVAAPVSGILTAIERGADARVRPGDVLGWIQP